MKKYIVTLTDDERQRLEQLLAKGKAAARTLRHAQALLKADQPVGWKDADLADAFGLSVRTVERLRQRFVEEGLEAALKPKPVPACPERLMANWRRTWSPWPAPTRPRAGSAGRCGCWRTGWSSWT